MWFLGACDLPYSTETWDAIRHLIELPWLDRLWVCQEAQLANFRATIRCGKDECWFNFRRAIYTLRHKNQLPSAYLWERLEFVGKMVADMRRTFLQTLSSGHSRDCCDRRDHVYSMLGLLPSKCVNRVSPDYSCSVSTVYKEAFLLTSSQFSRLNIIGYCDMSSRQIDEPTWAPDLSSGRAGCRGLHPGQWSSGV